MYLIKKKTTIIALVVLLAILVSAITLTQVIDTASAATIESYDDLDFKLVTNSDGSQSYSVSLKVAYRKTAEFVVVPNTYNELPVTEVAASGFMSCTKLTKVMLPKSVVTIGKNAFMNCSSLEHIAMPGVETIGDSAFSMCTKLERLYFPMSVKSVGTAILRNNSNTIYFQGSQEEIDRWWSSTWNSYFTGKTIEKVEPSDMIEYREILGMDNKTVVGYEIPEGQELPGGDIVIYNMYKSSDDAEYLPLLNICSEAFTGTGCDSLTIKDRHEDDPTVPEFTHKINIRSNAFLLAIIDEINIQVGVTFNHPQEGLEQGVQFSSLDQEPITGDANGHSTRVFEESTAQSITLPANIDIITERMFKNCVFLENIKINGTDYDGTNVLPNVDFIGAYAFESCIGLANLTISNSVTYFGHNVFEGWGINVTHQELNLDFYEGFVPGEADWSATGDDDDIANIATVHINYRKPTTIYIDLQDGSGKSIAIQVKPGLEMPELPELTRTGYEFHGIFNQEEGRGYQYYTDSKEVARLWKEGEKTKLYVYWIPVIYKITYDCNIPGVTLPDNPTEYTIESPNIRFILPELDGYKFDSDPVYIPTGSVGEINVHFIGTPEKYKITYVLNDGENHTSNPLEFDVTQHIELFAPTKKDNLFRGWYWNDVKITTLDGITENITLIAKWEYMGIETELNTSSNTTTVYAEKIYINLSNASYISGCKLEVANTVKELYIYSNAPITYYMSIEVLERDADITIKLINVSLRASNYCATITVCSPVTLYLKAENSAVYGKEGARGTTGAAGTSPSLMGETGGVGGTGYAAIQCHRLVIKDSITLYGGNGGTGGRGGSGREPGKGGTGGEGACAVDAKYIVVEASGVKLVGGNGGNGGDGALDYTGTKASAGGAGGAGAEATNAQITGSVDLVTGQNGSAGQKGSLGPITHE